MATIAWVLIASFSACRVVGRCLYICAFKYPQRKNHKVINQVTSLAGQAISPRKERRRPGNNSLKMLSNAVKCELWLRLVGTKFLLLHSPQETGSTLVGGTLDSTLDPVTVAI
ncbi:uncharacterized protein TNCV_2745801 [Trichonephila clavipes]|nr:uncharacterized protein TNCV_2745801 [Trichonephila clavipes]